MTSSSEYEKRREELAKKKQKIINQNKYGGSGTDITVQNLDGSTSVYAPGSQGYANVLKQTQGSSVIKQKPIPIVDNTQNIQTRIVDENPSKVDLKTGTVAYGSVKVDGKALRAQMESENAASELNNILSRATEDQADRGVTESQSADLSRVVEVEKTPAPPIIDEQNKETVKELIEADPRNEKLKGVIEDYKEAYPDDFKDVKPVPLDQLSPEDQEKRKILLRTTKECNIADSETVGKVLVRANPCRDTTFDKMEAQMTNFFNKVNGPTIPSLSIDMTSEIRQASKAMSRTMTTFVNKATGSLNDSLEQTIGNSMGALKSSVFSKISKAFPVSSAIAETVNSQLSIAPAIDGIIDSVYCVGSKVTDALGDTISDLLTAAVKNTTNVPSCAVQEIMGAVNNDLINKVDSLVTPQLAPIENLLGPLGFNFDVKNFMTSGVDVMKRIESFSTSCDDRPRCPSSTKFVIGKGIMKGGTAASTIGNFSKMMGATAISNKLTSLASGALPGGLSNLASGALPGGLSNLASGGLSNLASGALGDIASGALAGALPGGVSNLAAGGIGDLASGLAAGGITGGVSSLASGALSDFEKKYGVWNIFGSPLAAASGISPCNTGNPPKCGGPSMEIIGGGGSGGKGKNILGGFINRLDTEDIFAAVKKTASIVGVDITDPGAGYTSDPVVTFSDECDQGYGAFGKAHVDKNPQSPTYGQITSITIISSGENYPVDDEEVPLFIDKVIIENSGYGYEDVDTLDNFELEIFDGRIIGGNLVNQIAYRDLPELNINTATGVGAVLRPIMSKTRPQGRVIEVIDCIGK